MSETSLDPYYLLRWDFSRDLAIDRDAVLATHRLGELPLASDQGLQELLRRIPLSALSIHATGDNPAHPTEWQTGLLGEVTESEIIDLIKRGRLWVTVPQIDQHDNELAALVGRLAQELSECHVGLRIIDPHADLILSSPSAQYYYGCDAMPSVLWHLRGRMRLRIYPNDVRYVDQSDLQQIAYQQRDQRLYFEPAFDRQSRVFGIASGQMFSWPQPTPYRIENIDGLNVSLRLTFRTPRSLRQDNIHLVNRFLRRLMLGRFCHHRIDGFIASLKHVFAPLVRRWDQDSTAPQQEPTFVLDVSSPSGLRSLTEQAGSRESAPALGITANSSGIFPTPTSVMVLEN